METSAMYTLGQVRNVDICNLLVVSDELWNKWDPAFGTSRLREASEKARKIVLRALGKISLET
jgi:nucleoside phosphorylase